MEVYSPINGIICDYINYYEITGQYSRLYNLMLYVIVVFHWIINARVYYIYIYTYIYINYIYIHYIIYIHIIFTHARTPIFYDNNHRLNFQMHLVKCVLFFYMLLCYIGNTLQNAAMVNAKNVVENRLSMFTVLTSMSGRVILFGFGHPTSSGSGRANSTIQVLLLR